MTICIAVNRGDYIFMAADTRVTFGRPKQHHEDGHIKLYETGVGMITGSGWSQLLDRVKVRVMNENIEHTSDINNIIKNEQQAVKDINTYDLSCLELDENIASTGWFYSYCTFVNDQIKTRVSFVHGSEFNEREDNTVKSLHDGQAMIWVDGSVDPSVVKDYELLLNNFVSSSVVGATVSDSGVQLLNITQRLISNAADICDGVSKEFYYGFQTSGDIHLDGPIIATHSQFSD